jgi:hypothetical protein
LVDQRLLLEEDADRDVALAMQAGTVGEGA